MFSKCLYRSPWYYLPCSKHAQLQQQYSHWKLPSENTQPAFSKSNKEESIETMRARLLYQSRKRGILETDLLLSTFAKKYLPSFTREELETYDKFLQESDWEIYTWIVRKIEIPERWCKSNLLRMLQEHCQDKVSPIQRMPDLF